MKHLTTQLRLASMLSLFFFAYTVSYGQLTPSGDAYTNTADPTTNYGAKTLLDIESASQTTYIQFDLSAIPSGYTGANITKASLKLYVNTVAKAGSFNVDYVSGTWSESTITADKAPALGTTIAASVPLTAADKNQFILIDITTAVQAWLNGTANDGIALVGNNPLNATFDSKESTTTSHAAELVIVFAGGGGGGITGIETASGSGLIGGGTSGTLNLSLTNTCAAKQVLQWTGSAWGCASAGTGTITGVTAGTDLSGGGTSGNVTLSLNTSAANALYAQLAASNTFTANQLINGNLTATSGLLGEANSSTGSAVGVGGLAASPNGYGVEGLNTSSGNTGVGVYGTGGTGVYGVGTGSGVFGTTKSSIYAAVSGAGAGIGIYGSASGGSNTSGGDAGVWGDTGGTAGSFIAVLGTAGENYAGFFRNNNAGSEFLPSDTLYAENDETSSGFGVVFQATGPSFQGDCAITVTGSLSCNGTVSGVVGVEGGARQVALYAVQSPENWFEDAGSGQLSSGSARIGLDSTFAQTVNAGVEYHVFLMPNGDCKGLYVSQKSPTSFEVHELGGGTSDIAFDYRIMAKRKGYESVRLADLTGLFHKREAQRQKMLHPVPASAGPLSHSAKPIPISPEPRLGTRTPALEQEAARPTQPK
jgi:hypothetical protein